jgi:SAM-dependent methyltransferase
MTSALLDLLACPRDGATLARDGDGLICREGHRYAIVDDIPILLVADVPQTHWVIDLALGVAKTGKADAAPAVPDGGIDPFVQQAVGATHGNLYGHLIGNLPRYPIPEFPLKPSGPTMLIDLGCNWGRWSLSAARAGFRVVGLDPAFDGVRAARRVARQLGIQADFVVADARFIPIRRGAADVVFSNGVLQHFSYEDVEQAVSSAAQVLKPGGLCFIQMAARWGPRSLVQQARRGRKARAFEVRYWLPSRLLECFSRRVGPATLEPDSFFCLNARPDELDLMTATGRIVVRASVACTRLARAVPPLTRLADSVWVRAHKQ